MRHVGIETLECAQGIEERAADDEDVFIGISHTLAMQGDRSLCNSNFPAASSCGLNAKIREEKALKCPGTTLLSDSR